MAFFEFSMSEVRKREGSRMMMAFIRDGIKKREREGGRA